MSKKATRKKIKQSKNPVLESMDRKLEKEISASREANYAAASDPELNGKTKFQMRATEIGMALLAAAVGSLATVCILMPNDLTVGGITGIAILLSKVANWNYSVVYYILCFVVLLIVWLGLGTREVRKIVLMSVSYPTFMLLFQLTGLEYISEDKLLAAAFGGVLIGVANGLTFKAGFSSGGTDSLAKVIKFKQFPHLGINDITFVLNTIIVVLSALYMGLDVALYAVLTIYVSMKIGETVMYGLSTKIVELDIIPGDAEALTNFIMEELGRGVSSVEVTGEYTGDRRKQLKILCSPRESFIIKRYLAKNDPKSFVAVFGVNSVWGLGRGFSDIKKID